MASNFTCRTCLRALRTPRGLQAKSNSLAQPAPFIQRARPILACPKSTKASPSAAAQKVKTTPNVAPRPNAAKPPATTSTYVAPKPKESVAEVEAQPLEQEYQGDPETSAGSLIGTNQENYASYCATDFFFRECKRPAAYTIGEVKHTEERPKNEAGEDVGVPQEGADWYEILDLEPTFHAWAQITMLHVYLLITRLRHLPPSSFKIWEQHLTDHLFVTAEDNMVVYHGLNAASIRNKYLKDLFNQWRGLLAAYDEGIMRGDATLAEAVWRNIFKGADVDAVQIAMVTSWIRKEMSRLEGMTDDMLVLGKWKFGGLREEEARVLVESRWMKAPFEEAEEVEERVAEVKKA
ncbi:hypothetical protein K402DRAFT_453114 [Aulographum hederae CBS 113979]|uniref:Ubiquinol-cytochrome c chaperone domain-containing protein n=1 Tax=Aulographum hederae CBS 113979 TaxID=1176131 RepID=A0A6G1H4B5_9PEZI|nr:hypothetical protein K402DRAFT_453114 [Aulographum hederae CBS 113979]